MNARRILLSTLILCLGFGAWLSSQTPERAPSAGSAVRYDGDVVVRAMIRSDDDLAVMDRIAEDVWSHGVGIGPVDYLVPRERLDEIDAAGIDAEILVDDVQALVDRTFERGDEDGGFFTDYKTLAEIRNFVNALAVSRPDLAQVSTYGQSIEGRDLRVIKITGPGDSSDRPQLVYNYVQHAREWVTAMSGPWLAERLINGYGVDPYVTALLDQAEFWIVPITNPDGYEYSWTNDRLWRKNRRNNGGGVFGVDLNRNWDAGWGGEGSSGDPSSPIYRGTAPFSEPETAELRDLMLGLPRLAGHIDIHCYSQLVLQPYGYTAALPPDHAQFEDLGGFVAAAMESLYGKPFIHGPIWTTIYPAAGGAEDWSYDATGSWSLSFELRDTGEFGFLLPPEQIIPGVRESEIGALRHAEWILSTIDFAFPEGVPSFVSPTGPATFEVEITARDGAGVEPGSPALAWRVAGGGAFTEVPLTSLGGDLYEATLPTAACGTTIEFHVTARSLDGRTQSEPFAAPDGSFAADVADLSMVFEDDFQSDLGWTVENVSLSDGPWQRGVPADGDRGDPPADFDGSGACFVTDNVAGNSDVDGGPTRLVSPVFDLTGGDAFVEFASWIYCDDGDDTLDVEISNDGGATWVQASSRTGGGGWTNERVELSTVLPVTDAMRVRFSVSDNPNDSVTEAGVDAFRAYTVDCTPVESIVFTQTDLVRSQPATFTVTGAEPGTQVLFFFTKRGEGPGPCDDFGLCLDLVAPVRRFARATADGAGTASRTKTVPPGAPLIELHTQAINLRGVAGEDSVKSNVIAATVEE